MPAPAEFILVKAVTPELVKIMGDFAAGQEDLCKTLTSMI